MNNYDCIVAILAAHREARRWTDEDVAHDLLSQLGVDPVGEAKNARSAEPAVSQGDETARILTEQREAADAEVEQQRAAQDAATVDPGATKIGGGAIVF